MLDRTGAWLGEQQSRQIRRAVPICQCSNVIAGEQPSADGGKGFRLNMDGGRNAAIRTMSPGAVDQRILAGEDSKIRGPVAQQVKQWLCSTSDNNGHLSAADLFSRRHHLLLARTLGSSMSARSASKPVFSAKHIMPARLADTVADAIAAALFDGRIPPGEALPAEGEIAREFGVSKPIAREALRQLAAAGLIFTQQGKVARSKAINGEPMERIYGYAARSSLERLREANEMRRVIETGIARLAAERRDPVGLATMEQALRDMAGSTGEPSDFIEADILFHLGIALATGNTLIRVHMEGMRAIQREVSELFLHRANRTDADGNATVERHRAIFGAIAAGKPDLAEHTIIAHFEAADIASLEVAKKLGGGAGQQR
jgi:GntR family transcriptional repressor for pyruvate dehydrogenase complex